MKAQVVAAVVERDGKLLICQRPPRKVSVYKCYDQHNPNGTGVMVRWDDLVTDLMSPAVRLLEIEAITREDMAVATQLPSLIRELQLVTIGSYGQWWCEPGWGADPRFVIYFIYRRQKSSSIDGRRERGTTCRSASRSSQPNRAPRRARRVGTC